MRNHFPFALALLLLTSAGAFAAEGLSPAVQLNRLSRVLRGEQPSEAERNLLAEAVANKTAPAFLNAKTKEYLASEQHAYKMSTRLEELFRLKTNETPVLAALKEKEDADSRNYSLYSRNNALNDLFYRMARENQSWDNLLTAKTYRAFYIRRNRTIGLSDYGFLGALVPDLISTDGIYGDGTSPLSEGEILFRDLQFSPQEKQIAGALTTSRFFNRYVNTGLNKNRKRAAAVFRIFLCDSMSAAVPSSEGKDDHILDIMFPHSGVTEEQLRTTLNATEKLHGDRPDCMACHYKLDPLGKTFLTSPLVLSNIPSPGHLSYKRDNGEKVNIPVSGLAALGTAITQQPEYVRCQVRHFWNWFMGSQTLTPDREKQLISEFNQRGRRTNDFIQYLTTQNEFYTLNAPLTEDQLRTRQVKVLLQKCQNCHKDQLNDEAEDGKFPDFTVWPIGGNQTEMKHWVDRIYKKMDLENDGENPRMPPVEASWRTGFKEVQVVKDWIQRGAPDENGKPQVKP